MAAEERAASKDNSLTREVSKDGSRSPAADEEGGVYEWSAAVPAQVLFHLFEDPTFFSKGIFGNGRGGPNQQGSILIGISHAIIMVVNLLILSSTIAVCLETVPEFSLDPNKNPATYEAWAKRWNGLEVTCVVAFTVDLLMRFFGAAASGAEVSKQFFSDWMNLVDVVAIAPFYLEVMEWDIVDLRFLRVVRLVRILKTMSGRSGGDRIALITEIISRSYQALLVPVFFAGLALICLSSITYYIEATEYLICRMNDGTVIEGWVPSQGALGYYDDAGFYLGETHPLFPPGTTEGYAYNSGCTQDYGCACAGTLSYVDRGGTEWSSEHFESIPNVFWWCIVTFTTVGYGDVNPRTPVGQQLTAFTMFTGIFFLSMPISIVGDSFSRSWNKFIAKQQRAELAEMRSAMAEDKIAAIRRGETLPHTDVEGPHDALNADILGFFGKSKHKLQGLRPVGEAGANWDEALKMLQSSENTWMELYREMQSVA